MLLITNKSTSDNVHAIIICVVCWQINHVILHHVPEQNFITVTQILKALDLHQIEQVLLHNIHSRSSHFSDVPQYTVFL